MQDKQKVIEQVVVGGRYLPIMKKTENIEQRF